MGDIIHLNHIQNSEKISCREQKKLYNCCFLLRSSVLKLNFFSSDFLNFDFFIARNRRGRRKKDITLSKTRELGSAIESEQLSEFTEEEVGIH